MRRSFRCLSLGIAKSGAAVRRGLADDPLQTRRVSIPCPGLARVGAVDTDSPRWTGEKGESEKGDGQNRSLEVSTPLMGPSTPSTTCPCPCPSAVAVESWVPAEVEAATSRGRTPNEAHRSLYLARIFDRSAVRSTSVSGPSVCAGVSLGLSVGKVPMRSMRTLAWFAAL